MRPLAIQPEDERHPYVMKDFISLLQHNISKIANNWSDLRNPPCAIQEAFTQMAAYMVGQAY